MDTFSSSEDLVIKARKPYTITKQRERWTEEEHDRFLEALKLYGRAWQRIEEHIGTKTAVQIRSHAQKFFSKLEKEALVKGVPVGEALDIDIPPPRPKRKPSNPYPRKTGVSTSPSQGGAKDGKLLTSISSLHCKQALDLEKEPLSEKSAGDDKASNIKEQQEDSCSEAFTQLQDAKCSSVSSPNKSSVPKPVTLGNSCKFREFVPALREVTNQDETNESFVTTDFKSNQKLDKSAETQKVQYSGKSKVSDLEGHNKNLVEGNKSHNSSNALSTVEMQGAQSYPRNVPVHVLDGSLGTCAQTSDLSQGDTIFHPMGNVHGHANLFTNPAVSGSVQPQNNSPKSSFRHPSFHPSFTPFCHNQDDYQSLFHVSSAFSSLIVSTLLQNPAAHAAANFAATYWPYGNSRHSPESTQGGSQSKHINSTTDMTAIVGATVAAATAWWAAHGLLPVCAPLNTAFNSTPASTTVVKSMDIDQVHAEKVHTDKKEGKEDAVQNPPLQGQHLDLESPEALQVPPSALSSASEECGGAKLIVGSQIPDHDKAAAVNEVQDSDKSNIRKPVDRSSCGSNTPSSSDVETDALEKLDKGSEEPKEADANNLGIDSNNRRGRFISNLNDSWKEVSEGGRIAFHALFNREVLPQSFSPPQDQENKEHQNNKGEENHNMQEKNKEETNKDERSSNASILDLNNKACGSLSDHQEGEKTVSSAGDNDGEGGLLTTGLGNAKFKSRRTGFKPYKRCSVEARENRVEDGTSQGEEKGPKRIRLDGEASM